MRGTRLVIPQALRGHVLEMAHEGHRGIGKTKRRLHSKVCWQKIDAEAEKVYKTCHGCQVVDGYPAPMAQVAGLNTHKLKLIHAVMFLLLVYRNST